jgi:hypothetical protein
MTDGAFCTVNCATSDRKYTIPGNDGADECFYCDSSVPAPDTYCAICDCVYHDLCFSQDSLHEDDDLEEHQRFPLKRRYDQAYINQPNLQNTISQDEILRDRKNLFIEIDHRTLKLKFGDNAFNLLRPSTLDVPGMPNGTTIPSPMPTPGFISFLGQTGTGKSWIIRSLMKDHPAIPSPLPSPGNAPNCTDSISSNINVYVDGKTLYTKDPILFMDVEGLDGSDVPITLKEIDRNPPPARRAIAQTVYPKIAYTFSNCIVFICTDSMQAGRSIIDKVKKFTDAASRGSRHQGFRPSLFIIFNKLVDDTDLSIDASTSAFKTAFKDLIQLELEAYFDAIHVVKIPHSSQSSSPTKALDQLDKLGILLSQEHLNACARRPQFSLSFSLDGLTRHLETALDVFSGEEENPSFDWTKEMIRNMPSLDSSPPSPLVQKEEEDLPSSRIRVAPSHAPKHSSWQKDVKVFWRRCLQYHQHEPLRNSFRYALRKFTSQFVFCVQLFLHRFPVIGLKVGTLSEGMVKSVFEIQRDIENLIPCRVNRIEDGTACGGTRQRHNINRHESLSGRWIGKFEPIVQVNLVRAIEKSLSNNAGRVQLSVLDAPNQEFMCQIRCIATCLGCLILPPSVFLACGHTFCEMCIGDMTGEPHDVHNLESIRCLFCSREMPFSPRLLPPPAGYRILSIDGGGVRGVAPIHLLAAIEDRCFGIPIVQLFDFIIGTSIGGHIALSLASKETPVSVADLKKEFFDLMRTGIKRRLYLESSVVNAVLLVLFNLSTHRNDPMESSLKRFFGSGRHVLDASDPPGPLVAVTTVPMDDLSATHIIPN